MSQDIVKFVESLTGRQRAWGWFLLDLLGFIAAGLLTYFFFYRLISIEFAAMLLFVGLFFVVYKAAAYFTQGDSEIVRYSGSRQFMLMAFNLTAGAVVAGLLTLLFYRHFSGRLIILCYILVLSFSLLSRILWQIIYTYGRRRQADHRIKNIILIGAGDGAHLFMQNYKQESESVKILAAFDDDPSKAGKKIEGVPIIGSVDSIANYVAHQPVDEAVIAIPSLPPEDYTRILEILNQLGIAFYKMPKLEDLVLGNYSPNNQLQDIDITDLLGRDEIKLDESKLHDELYNKTILVTGAGGSIGSEIVRQVSKFNPARVVLLGHGENSIYLINQEMQKNRAGIEYIPIITDIQNYQRLYDVFSHYQPDIVYHAAAHKHVPLMEGSPREAFLNNVKGTYNVAKAVNDAHIKKMVMISTDKAVNSTNVMGSTKRMAELIVTGFDKVSQSTYCAVRFGNVLGSRGSVIPLFKKQIAAGGPVTVTDFRMTRYFMTIPEASRLVIYAGASAQGGEVFILDMDEPVKIIDLAKKIILLSGHSLDEIKIVESGIRPGEKLYEELLTGTEQVDSQLNEKVFVGKVAKFDLDKIESKIAGLDQIDDDDQLKAEIIAFANQTTAG
ncbi:NDP-sugar epimerase, includes UDP-GlcNAc-inverting 4,6-dehydratase FlaA1 and capsular polysaccharide biosynthesis protein EpsC [Aerococcus urinaehominis]|nr:nucleoside-diphosphate sugar epimerase/dehydratase [Aerococcus urinaehominis]SDM64550.1 NDP-sugar epimerase, includes UDP-GlcNAc-inverting 4,6-dehydratase FlaA1 and capsular polysaccharide biosynthesis protein EpsC [Aerococcus urinaehominis]